MEYREMVNQLLTEKMKDPRFAFPSYIVSACERVKDGILDTHYHQIHAGEPLKKQSDYFFKGIPIGRLRDAMNCENQDISNGMVEESILHVPFSDHTIDLTMYRPFHTSEILPCIVYFHGGAYMGGSIKVTANICRALADRYHATVINVDYRLAPEHPYPKPGDDCYGCFNWICDHADMYNIREDEIYVAGDSAGGNFAINCCIREHELEIHRIKGCILYYPHVLMMETKEYPWDLDMYYIADEDKSEITRDIIGLKEVIRLSEFYYLQGAIEKNNALVSPLLYEQLDGLPPVLMISAEFDYLRIQQEYFAQRLDEVNNMVKLIQYQGMQHAFMDHIGLFPQAEAVIQETCAFLQDIKMKKNVIL